MARRGVTLVELVAVVAIVGLLIAMLLPAVLGATEYSRRIACQNNQKQLALGLLNYHSEHEAFPPGYAPLGYGGHPGPDTAWGILVLPYIEQRMLWSALDGAAPIESAENSTFRTHSIKTFTCPTSLPTYDRPDAVPLSGPGLAKGFAIARASFVGCFGTGDPLGLAPGDGMFPRGTSIRIEDVLDGTSTTILTGERASEAGPTTWAGIVGPQGANWVLGSTGGDAGPNVRPLRPSGFSSRHPGGAYVSFGDGSVRWIRNGIGARVYGAMATRRGGEIVNIDE
jgi:prepilin-type N-terminal cleavage/methylation domain-containing protein/prepilin-type processing-associated H-X9-DG protein